ncbi:hypothetical protein CFC21_109574 [Triticum aestivum]|uniref:FAE domain-containing protein n=2 Tax=Triticum aestivum TaxID=4565 RepID=A0A9R1ML80_WHEAT|nr:hypothetical protein CFC21_109573 [Triticum aestivum]KAF7109284.1 hypothetical protein CFC21_109574 [Triticum aestivum]
MEGGVGVTLEPPVEALDRLPRPSPVHVFLATFLPAVAAVLYLMMRPCSVYLVNYSCFHTNPSHRVSLDTFLEHAKLVIFIEGAFIDERNVRLMTRLLERFGLGKETCVPPAHHFVLPYRNLEASVRRWSSSSFPPLTIFLPRRASAPTPLTSSSSTAASSCPSHSSPT